MRGMGVGDLFHAHHHDGQPLKKPPPLLRPDMQAIYPQPLLSPFPGGCRCRAAVAASMTAAADG